MVDPVPSRTVQVIPPAPARVARPAPSHRPPLLTSIRWPVYGIRLLACVAAGICAYLFLLAAGHDHAVGCGAASDCDYVLGSRWSRVLGVPVAALALLTHFGILLTSFALARKWAWALLSLLSTAAAAAAAWFLFLQWRVLQSFCPWCAAAHACALVLWFLVLYAAFRRHTPASAGRFGTRRATIAFSMGVGLAGAAALAVAQWRHTGSYNVRILNRPLDLPRDQAPLLGPPDAPHTLVLLGDYTCPHCRELHRGLTAAQARYGSQINLIVLPVPLNSHCNRAVKRDQFPHRHACEVNRIALAVWKANPAAFPKMDRILFAPADALLPAEARDEAANLVGAEALRRAESDPQLERMLARDVDLYVELGGGPIPKLLVGSAKLDGPVPSESALFDLIERQFHIRPQAAGSGPGT